MSLARRFFRANSLRFVGTKQAPFQTIYGAFKHRGADAHIFVKRRCVYVNSSRVFPLNGSFMLLVRHY